MCHLPTLKIKTGSRDQTEVFMQAWQPLFSPEPWNIDCTLACFGGWGQNETMHKYVVCPRQSSSLRCANVADVHALGTFSWGTLKTRNPTADFCWAQWKNLWHWILWNQNWFVESVHYIPSLHTVNMWNPQPEKPYIRVFISPVLSDPVALGVRDTLKLQRFTGTCVSFLLPHLKAIRSTSGLSGDSGGFSANCVRLQATSLHFLFFQWWPEAALLLKPPSLASAAVTPKSTRASVLVFSGLQLWPHSDPRQPGTGKGWIRLTDGVKELEWELSGESTEEHCLLPSPGPQA